MMFSAGSCRPSKTRVAGRVVHHHAPWSHGEVFGLPQVNEEDGEPAGAFFDLIDGCSAGKQDHQIRLLDPGDVDLAPVHHVMGALARCCSLYGGGVRTRLW